METILKTPFNVILFIIVAHIILNNCAPVETLNGGTRSATIETTEEIGNYDDSVDLTTHLQRVRGVTVNGSGPYAQIRVRGGENTINASNEPLFVLNDVPQTNGYASLYSMIKVDHIMSIKVLKGPDAARYGGRGTNGVIIINTQ